MMYIPPVVLYTTPHPVVSNNRRYLEQVALLRSAAYLAPPLLPLRLQLQLLNCKESFQDQVAPRDKTNQNSYFSPAAGWERLSGKG